MKKSMKPLLLLIALIAVSISGLKAQTVNGVLQADPSSLSFTTTVNHPVTQTVYISPLDQDFLSRLLSPVIDVKIQGTNANQFSIDANNVSVVDILNSVTSGNPIDIEVTYNPTAAGTHSAVLVIGTPNILGIGVTLLNIPLNGVAH